MTIVSMPEMPDAGEHHGDAVLVGGLDHLVVAHRSAGLDHRGGAGQMSRVDSARIAARKAQDAAAELKLAEPLTKGSVVASDAFFPFADGMLACIEAGATAVIQPGGSVRDDEVIKAADDHGIAMVFTGVRHFRH